MMNDFIGQLAEATIKGQEASNRRKREEIDAAITFLQEEMMRAAKGGADSLTKDTSAIPYHSEVSDYFNSRGISCKVNRLSGQCTRYELDWKELIKRTRLS